MAEISYSLVEGGIAGPGNRDADPLFRNRDGQDGIFGTSDDDLQLQPDSPAVDAGDNAGLPNDNADLDGDGNRDEPLSRDAAGRPRAVDDPAAPDTGAGEAPLVDMGAYMGVYQVSFTSQASLDAGVAAVSGIAFTVDPLAPLHESPADAADYELAFTPGPTAPATHTLYLPILRR